MCQASGLPPTAKYQSDGGPSPEQIVALLRQEVRPTSAAIDSVDRFVNALAYSWIVAGTDAHAKNYSVLLAGGQARLAPLYDVASALPYDDMYVPKLRMAMRVGGEYRLDEIGGRHWRRLAEQLGLDPDRLIRRIDDLAVRTPEGFSSAATADAVSALDSDLPARLLDRVAARASRCRELLARD